MPSDLGLLGFLPYLFTVALGLMIHSRRGGRGSSLATSLGLSLGVESSLLLALGWLQAFTATWILLVNAILLSSAFLLSRPRGPVLAPPRQMDRWLVLALALVILSTYSAALPRKGYDAHKYHFYHARIIAMDGGIPSWGEVYDHHWFFPQMYGVLLASTWAFDPVGYRAAYLLNAFLGAICGLALYELSMKIHGNRRHAMLAAVIFYLTPLFFTHTTNGYSDILLGMYTLLGALNMASGRHMTSGLMFGLGAWAKVFGLLNVLFLLACFALKRKRVLAGALVMAIGVGSVFFVRNTIVLGDPLSFYSEEHPSWSLSAFLGPQGGRALTDVLGWWLLDYSSGEDFISLTHRGLGVMLPVFLIYALVFTARRPRSLLLLALVWSITVIVYCSFMGAEGNFKQITRYALPGLLPLCAFSARGLGEFLDDARSAMAGRFRLLLVLACVAYPSLAYAMIPMLDAVSATGSPLPGEDLYFEAKLSAMVGLREQIPDAPYTARVAWIGTEVRPYMELTPYVLRQRRVEWPRMWTSGLVALDPGWTDYVVVPAQVLPPEKFGAQLVYLSDEYRLYRVESEDD